MLLNSSLCRVRSNSAHSTMTAAVRYYISLTIRPPPSSSIPIMNGVVRPLPVSMFGCNNHGFLFSPSSMIGSQYRNWNHCTFTSISTEKPIATATTNNANNSSSATNNKSKSDNSSNKSSNSNVFLDNIGTIFLAFIGSIIGWLVRSHFNTKNKNHIRDMIELQSVIDPFEIYDLRQANSDILTVPIFRTIVRNIIQNSNQNSDDLVVTYQEFVAMVRKIMIHENNSADKTIQLGYLLDRVVASVLEKSYCQENNHDKTVESYKMPIQLWLTVLSMALHGPVQDRIAVLYEIMQIPRRQRTNDTTGTEDSNKSNDDQLQSFHTNEESYGNDANTSSRPDDNNYDLNDNTTKVLTIHDIYEMVGYLQDTCQLVPDSQVVATDTKYPIQQYERGTPEKLVVWGNVSDESAPSSQKIQEQQTRSNDNNASIDLDAFTSILCSKSVCAWGECYNRK
jgi:hypothetical protein